MECGINWEVLTTDKWVTEAVKYFKFLPPVSQFRSTGQAQLHSYSYVFSRAKLTNIRGSEYTVRKGAVIQVYNPQLQESFYSILFLVPKEEPAEATDKPQEVK